MNPRNYCIGREFTSVFLVMVKDEIIIVLVMDIYYSVLIMHHHLF